MAVPPSAAAGFGGAQAAGRGITVVFRHDLCGGQLLAVLSDAEVAAELVRALTAVAERDESFTGRFYPLDNLGVVREICSAVQVAVPATVEAALASAA